MKEVENLYSEKVATPKGTFEDVKTAKEKKKPFISSPSGPSEASGADCKVCDPKTLKGKESFHNPEKFSSQNFSENIEKKETRDINNFMSKSIFDKLFEDVMGMPGAAEQDTKDAIDLGIDVGGGEASGSEEGGEVTLTLDKDLAQKLHDALVAVLGGEEDKGDEGSSEGSDEGSSEEGSSDASEDAEEKAKKDKKDEDEIS